MRERSYDKGRVLRAAKQWPHCRPLLSDASMAHGARHFRTLFDPTSSQLMRGASRWLVCASMLLPAGCSGVQSALDPAGREAEQIAHLFWWMVAGAFVIWVAVIGLALYCARARAESFSRRWASLAIIGGGAVVPTIVLAILLVFGLGMLPRLVAPAPAGSLQIAVSGELWWWRVRYQTSGGEPV